MDDSPDNATPTDQAPPYPRSRPPAVLYHAVPADRLAAALRDGLAPTARRHVHLARRADHARNALRDEQRPVVLAIDAAAMHDAGHAFYASPKATWLVGFVPPAFLSEVSHEGREGDEEHEKQRR